MSHVLTLVAPPAGLDAAQISLVREALRSLGADVTSPDWLSSGEAADLPFSRLAPDQAVSAAHGVLQALPVDAIAQEAEGRRKRLLIADMDSTIVTSETLDELAAYAGLKERVAEITRRSMNGELDFAAALRERVGMLKGLSL